MHSPRLIAFLLAFFVASVAASVHSSPDLIHRHWSRHVQGGRPQVRSLKRRSCRSKTSASSASVSATAAVNATSTLPSSSSFSTHATTTKVHTTTSSTSSSSSSSPKHTSSSAKATPSQSSSQSSSLTELLPISTSGQTWTTSSLSKNALPLSDSTLNPFKIETSLTHTYMDAPDGKYSMQAHYPEGSHIPSELPAGGISFYAPGPTSVDITTAKEATFGYRVYFDEGFEFNKGGKLPGLYGGDDADDAVSCSGGRRSLACWSVRMMWRTDAAGELYTYLPPYTTPGYEANEVQCNVAPFSTCNPTYGASVGRGAFSFKAGAWTTVSERIKLNDVGQANGEMELFANGVSVISVSGLIFRDSAAGTMRGIQMQTFFGGNTPDYASPQSQNAYFSDFSVAILETL